MAEFDPRPASFMSCTKAGGDYLPSSTSDFSSVCHDRPKRTEKFLCDQFAYNIQLVRILQDY